LQSQRINTLDSNQEYIGLVRHFAIMDRAGPRASGPWDNFWAADDV